MAKGGELVVKIPTAYIAAARTRLEVRIGSGGDGNCLTPTFVRLRGRTSKAAEFIY